MIPFCTQQEDHEPHNNHQSHDPIPPPTTKIVLDIKKNSNRPKWPDSTYKEEEPAKETNHLHYKKITL